VKNKVLRIQEEEEDYPVAVGTTFQVFESFQHIPQARRDASFFKEVTFTTQNPLQADLPFDAKQLPLT